MAWTPPYDIATPISGQPRNSGETEVAKFTEIDRFIADASGEIVDARTHHAVTNGAHGYPTISTIALNTDPRFTDLRTSPNNTVTTAQLQDDSVTTDKLADDSVTGAQIASGAVGSTEIGAGQVNGAHYAALSVNTPFIAAGAITTSKVADGLDGAKLLDESVAVQKLTVTNPGLWGATDLLYLDATGTLSSPFITTDYDPPITQPSCTHYVRFQDGNTYAVRASDGEYITGAGSDPTINAFIINECIADGGPGAIVQLPPGNIQVTGTIVPSYGCVIRGAGATFDPTDGSMTGTTLVAVDQTDPIIQWGTPGGEVTNPHGVEISHLNINLSGYSATGIKVVDCNNPHIHHVNIYGGGVGVDIDGGSGARISDCHITGPPDGCNVVDHTDGTLTNSRFTENASSCTDISGSAGWTIHGNRFTGINNTTILLVFSGATVTITDNTFSQSAVALTLDSTGISQVRGNTFNMGVDFTGSNHGYVHINDGFTIFVNNTLRGYTNGGGTSRANLKAFVRINPVPAVSQTGNNHFAGTITGNLTHLQGATSGWVGPVCDASGVAVLPTTSTDVSGGAYVTNQHQWDISLNKIIKSS